MEMQIIEKTKHTPRVVMNPQGQIRIEGRSLIEDPFTFYEPIFKWIKEVSMEMLSMDIKLEYLNTSSTKQLFNLIYLAQSNPGIKAMQINWYYEIDDEDTLELGKEIESLLNVTFNFCEIAEEIN